MKKLFITTFIICTGVFVTPVHANTTAGISYQIQSEVIEAINTSYENEKCEESINLTMIEYELLAQVAYCEARGEVNDGDNAVEAMRRVISVILNRVNSDKFPNTIEEVISQTNPKQFSCYPYCLSVTPTEYCYEAVDAEVIEQIDTESLYFSRGLVPSTTYNYTYLNHVFSY